MILERGQIHLDEEVLGYDPVEYARSRFWPWKTHGKVNINEQMFGFKKVHF